jgi:hypothetical protein
LSSEGQPSSQQPHSVEEQVEEAKVQEANSEDDAIQQQKLDESLAADVTDL